MYKIKFITILILFFAQYTISISLEDVLFWKNNSIFIEGLQITATPLKVFQHTPSGMREGKFSLFIENMAKEKVLFRFKQLRICGLNNIKQKIQLNTFMSYESLLNDPLFIIPTEGININVKVWTSNLVFTQNPNMHLCLVNNDTQLVTPFKNTVHNPKFFINLKKKNVYIPVHSHLYNYEIQEIKKGGAIFF